MVSQIFTSEEIVNASQPKSDDLQPAIKFLSPD